MINLDAPKRDYTYIKYIHGDFVCAFCKVKVYYETTHCPGCGGKIVTPSEYLAKQREKES